MKPRPHLVAVVVCSIGLAVVACGGAGSQDVLGSSSGASGGTSGGASSGTSGNTSGGTSGNTSGGTSGNTSGGTSGNSSGFVDAGVCPPETEPNDSADTANTISPTMCGAIQPNSESDFLTFQLKPTSTSVNIKFTGSVTLRVDVGGNSVTLGNGNANKVPFVKNGRYVIEIKATQRATSIPWRVDVIEL